MKLVEPAFGAINLEDIAQPKCFAILERLRAEMAIPVWHDDQQGTATALLAGFLNALKCVGKERRAFPLVAVAAGLKAQEQGVARLAKSREELCREAERTMRQAREAVRVLMSEGLIGAPPAGDVGDD